MKPRIVKEQIVAGERGCADMTERKGVCWMVWCRNGFECGGEWFPWENTVSSQRRDSIASADWLEDGEYRTLRKRGVLKCVRTILTARLP